MDLQGDVLHILVVRGQDAQHDVIGVSENTDKTQVLDPSNDVACCSVTMRGSDFSALTHSALWQSHKLRL